MKKKFDSNHPENWQAFLKQKRERVQQPLVASKTVFKPKSAEAAWLNERLDLMIADARLVGIPDKFIMSATMDWAAQRTYAAGGYDSVKTALLDLFQTILILAAKKPRAD